MRFALLLLLATGVAVPAQSLAVRERTSTPPEMGTLRWLELSRAGHTYSLVPPGPGWRTRLDAPNARFQFSQTAGTANMALRFTTNTARDVLASADTLRRHAAPELGEARKLAEVEIFSGDSAGKAADFAYTLLGHDMRCRVAALPVPGGTVEFVLHCGAEEFTAAQRTLGAMINSFLRTSRTASETKAAAPAALAQRDQPISGE